MWREQLDIVNVNGILLSYVYSYIDNPLFL